jgi:hypothetical protein
VHGKLPPNELRQLLSAIHADLDLVRPSLPLLSSQNTEAQSDLSVQLASRILNLGLPPHPPAVHSKINEIASTVDTFIQTNLYPSSPIFASNLSRIRSALALILTNELLSFRSDPLSSSYDEGAHLACGARDQTGLDASEDDLDMVTDDDEPSNSSPAAEFRARHEAVLACFQEIEEQELRVHGLEVVGKELRALIGRMSRIVGFNLTVFSEVYAGPGMLVGS